MIKFIVDEQPTEKGVHLIHNGDANCLAMPKYDDQILIGYFADFELAYKRARMNWPREKVEGCTCCQA